MLKPSNLSQRPSASIRDEVDDRRKDGLRKETFVVWKGKGSGHKNSQPMHDGKSPGPLAIKLVLCNREWACVVSAIYNE